MCKSRSLVAGVTVVAGLVLAMLGSAQHVTGETQAERARRLMAEDNPFATGNSVWMEALTYMDVRDRIATGFTTVIVPTGGIEENGPYLVTGKHNVILEALCPAIARELGKTLCAPIVKFVPEGNIDPPSAAMYFPGSFSVRDETYQALLEDIGGSLKQHGFRDIVFIGDSGGNQTGMRAAAKALNHRWDGSGVRAHFIKEYYSPGWENTEKYTQEILGIAETKNDGYHDDMWVTAMMMVTDPTSVRYAERLEAGLASINGVDISDREKTIELGRKMVAWRAAYTADVIRSRLRGQ